VKLLLDENLPHRLRHEPPGHECVTVTYMKWNGTLNGELLRRAAAAGFDALITNDRGLEYEQDPQTLPLAVVVLLSPSSVIDDLRPLLPALRGSLEHLRPRALTKVGRA
jgi:hypothetical protein